MKPSHLFFAAAVVLCLGVPPSVFAQSAPSAPSTAVATSPEARTKEREAAIAGAIGASVGDTEQELAGVARLRLDGSLRFVPQAEGRRLMLANGNVVGPSFLGLAIDLRGGWLAVVTHTEEGHVGDEEARDWNADALMQSLREGSAAANVERVQRGFPPVEVVGWVKPPTYDAAGHRLVWAATARAKESDGAIVDSVNYNTYVLGRTGYVSLNLLAGSGDVERHVAEASDLVSRVSFVEGRRYEDFQPSSDKVAAYGIAALVGGVAAKKLGLLAALGVVAVKFGKIGLIAIAAVGYGLLRLVRRLFGRPAA